MSSRIVIETVDQCYKTFLCVNKLVRFNLQTFPPYSDTSKCFKWTPCHKHLTWVRMFARDKHVSLFCYKKFPNIELLCNDLLITLTQGVDNSNIA